MNAKRLGLCGLLCGVNKVAAETNRKKEEITAFVSLVRYENTLFLQNILNTLKDINGVLKPDEIAEALALPEVLVDLFFNSEKKEIKVAKAKFNQELVGKILILYESGVKLKEIDGLYEVNLTKIMMTIVGLALKNYNYEKIQKTILEILRLMVAEVHLERILDKVGLKSGNKKLLRYLRPFTREKLFFDSESINEVIRGHDQGTAIISLSLKHFWTKNTIKTWVKNYESQLPFNKGLAIESDDEGPSLVKRRKIEEMYLTGNQRISENTLNVEYYNEQIWVENFQKNCKNTVV